MAVPRCPLPAAELTVAMYLQMLAERSKSYSPFKKASAAIAFFQKVNLHHHRPTRAPAVEMVRAAAIRKFGTAPKKRKTPFIWVNVVAFAKAYRVQQQVRLLPPGGGHHGSGYVRGYVQV